MIRPKLMMTKLVQDQVTCTPDELKWAFEAHYGETIEGRMILWPPTEEKIAKTRVEPDQGQ